MIESFRLESNEILNLMLFTDVHNYGEIIEKIANDVYPFTVCTVVNPKLILEPFQIAVAANKALISKNSNTMITKSLPTELLFNLSTSDNITESLHKFGYDSKSDREILLAIFGNNIEQLQHIIAEVQGTRQPLSMLGQIHDIKLIKEAYDITEAQLTVNSLLNLIVTKIACKSV